MLQAVIIVILFYQAQLIQCATTDYCLIERTMCYKRSHVGCRNSSILSTNVPLNVIQFDSMVDYINAVRREYSTTSKIGNMNMIMWDSELAYLAEQKIIKSESDCFKTNRHPEVYMYRREFVGSGIFIFLQTKNSKYLYTDIQNRATWFFMNPDTTSIGCAAYFNENVYGVDFNLTNSPTVILICLLNGSEKSDYSEMFRPGEPCSGCNQMGCSKGLCFGVAKKSTKMNSSAIMFASAIYILLIIVVYLLVAISAALYYIVDHSKVIM